MEGQPLLERQHVRSFTALRDKSLVCRCCDQLAWKQRRIRRRSCKGALNQDGLGVEIDVVVVMENQRAAPDDVHVLKHVKKGVSRSGGGSLIFHDDYNIDFY